MRGIARGSMLAAGLAVVLVATVVGLTAGPAAARRGDAATAWRAPAAAARDNTSTVCVATATTVSEGLDKFVAAMQAVSTAAGQGDLVAAEKAVRAGGVDLVEIAVKLRSDAAIADNAQLKRTVADLAAEFEQLGRSLTSLTSLQTFDTTTLDGLASRMSDLCGGLPAPTPGPSGTAPGPGATTPAPGPRATTPAPGPPAPPQGAPRTETRVHDW